VADAPGPAPARPVVLVDGVERYKANPIIRFLLDEATAGRQCDLNRIWTSGFSRADLQEFYQLIGYSVSGYGDVFSSLDDEGTLP